MVPNCSRFMGAMLWILPLSMIFAWLFPVAMTVRAVVREKEVSQAGWLCAGRYKAADSAPHQCHEL